MQLSLMGYLLQLTVNK